MTKNKTQLDSANLEQTLNGSEAFIAKNKKTILYTIAAILIVIAGFFLYKSYVAAPREQKADELLFKGQQYFANGNYAMALNGDSIAYPGFLSIADEYSCTKAGNLAQLYAGLSYAHMNQPKEAIECLKDFDGCGDDMISPAALGALGNCYAEVGELEKAASTLMKAAKKADNNSLSPLYLMNAGEILETMGKKSEALDCYETIKEQYATSMQAADIEKYIERVSE